MCLTAHRRRHVTAAYGTDEGVTYLSIRWMGLMIQPVITSRS
jgi:tRNA splicing endonuclease